MKLGTKTTIAYFASCFTLGITLVDLIYTPSIKHGVIVTLVSITVFFSGAIMRSVVREEEAKRKEAFLKSQPGFKDK